ncbi:hypothetical protein [Faecalimonas umbilicata]|uniref:hypothetical protein n=1 Tax=Faecalimonas umbilicata TaxID=1912855 RepID=UPI0022E01554|nr:hypothetical protein [Faecalimonas umbilicata]
MAYYSIEEMKKTLEEYPKFQDRLYCKGFLITNKKQNIGGEYPFYSNWSEQQIANDFYMYIHKETYSYTYEKNGVIHFLVGHAYDPYNMLVEEKDILENLANALEKDEETYWEEESKLTGVFCVGYLLDDKVVYTTDCAGMQLVYHGVIDGKLFITSHGKLVADLEGLKQPEYIKRLTTNKYWHYWGTWLPGDLAPFEELKRMVPNHAGRYLKQTSEIDIFRFYPTRKVVETSTEKEYNDTIHELGRVMSNTMKCIAMKWPEKKVSISVTGGRDSMTALACSKDVYDKFDYFSYISNVDESVDAYAAKDILAHLGLEHELYQIPEEWDGYEELPAFKKVMECNNGCIGANNTNDLKKRLYFTENPPCDMEIKSWVNEMGRGWYYNKYNKKKFPKYPYASYWRTMHKVYLEKYLIKETDKVFAEYLEKYYDKETFDKISWLELYFWEFAWSGGEGIFLTTEHRVSYDITIPFNNRKYVELMLTVPLEKRKVDDIPNDLITYMEPRIAETGITIKDISHTNFRAFVVRVYLEIFSKIRYGKKKEKY